MSTRRSWTLACIMPLAVTLAACGDEEREGPSESSTQTDASSHADAGTETDAAAVAVADASASYADSSTLTASPEPHANEHAAGQPFGGSDGCIVDSAERIWSIRGSVSTLAVQQGSAYFADFANPADPLQRLVPPFDAPKSVAITEVPMATFHADSSYFEADGVVEVRADGSAGRVSTSYVADVFAFAEAPDALYFYDALRGYDTDIVRWTGGATAVVTQGRQIAGLSASRKSVFWLQLPSTADREQKQLFSAPTSGGPARSLSVTFGGGKHLAATEAGVFFTRHAGVQDDGKPIDELVYRSDRDQAVVSLAGPLLVTAMAVHGEDVYVASKMEHDGALSHGCLYRWDRASNALRAIARTDAAIDDIAFDPKSGEIFLGAGQLICRVHVP